MRRAEPGTWGPCRRGSVQVVVRLLWSTKKGQPVCGSTLISQPGGSGSALPSMRGAGGCGAAAAAELMRAVRAVHRGREPLCGRAGREGVEGSGNSSSAQRGRRRRGRGGEGGGETARLETSGGVQPGHPPPRSGAARPRSNFNAFPHPNCFWRLRFRDKPAADGSPRQVSARQGCVTCLAG